MRLIIINTIRDDTYFLDYNLVISHHVGNINLFYSRFYTFLPMFYECIIILHKIQAKHKK